MTSLLGRYKLRLVWGFPGVRTVPSGCVGGDENVLREAYQGLVFRECLSPIEPSVGCEKGIEWNNKVKWGEVR